MCGPMFFLGKKGQGVFLYQLAEVIVRTLLLAVLKAAPENLRENLFRTWAQPETGP